MMDNLPEDCILCILSSTTPRDTCQFSAMSKWARTKAESDFLWKKFLPSDYDEILPILVSPIHFKSNKELFVRLLSPVHVDGGNKLLWLDRSTGKICYMLSARELSITWGGDNPISWSWKPLLDSRFPEVVELLTTWWLEIRGKINSHVLSPNTTYKAYLIIKFSKRAYGLDTLMSEIMVELGEQRSYGRVYLRPGDGKPLRENLGLLKKVSSGLSNYEGKDKVIHKRIDGWFEIELGEFYNYGNDEVVKMSLQETEGVHLKGGLIIDGIEIRPK